MSEIETPERLRAESTSSAPENETTADRDPQENEDEHVKETKKHIQEAPAEDLAEIAERWRAYARNGTTRAVLAELRTNPFDAALHRTRAAVRTEAADLLSTFDSSAKAAQAMLDRVRDLWQYNPRPWGKTIEERQAYDASLLRYVRARTWQACAQELDPTVEEIQRRWE